MSIYLILLQLTGAVTLLLFSARMVRTGMERALRDRLKHLMAAVGKSRLRGAGIGLDMAVLLQSATAVAAGDRVGSRRQPERSQWPRYHAGG